jgi:hypothetical protein
VAVAECARYRPRRPQATPLYRLIETYYNEVKAQWEERFERRYGFWRGFVDEQVRRYLDCDLFENGFARIRCPECHAEYLLVFSCKTRELCPSCQSEMRIIAFILDRQVIDTILRHLACNDAEPNRAPPGCPAHEDAPQ